MNQNLQETFQVEIQDILRNIEPALENVFLKKKNVYSQKPISQTKPTYSGNGLTSPIQIFHSPILYCSTFKSEYTAVRSLFSLSITSQKDISLLNNSTTAPFRKIILNPFPKNAYKGISLALKISFKNVAKLTVRPDFSHPVSLTDLQTFFSVLKYRNHPLNNHHELMIQL